MLWAMLQMDLVLAGSVSLRAGSVLGPLGVTILAVSVLVAGFVLNSIQLAVLSLACSCLAVLLIAGSLVSAAIDAVVVVASCASGRSISILCCQSKAGQQA
jgi:hypothetical protein